MHYAYKWKCKDIERINKIFTSGWGSKHPRCLLFTTGSYIIRFPLPFPLIYLYYQIQQQLNSQYNIG